MSAAKQAFYSLSSLLPLSWLTRFSPQRILLPYHHVVSNEPLPHIQNLYAYKGQRQFEKDLDWLLQHFRPLHPQQIRDHIFHEKQLPPHGFLLSFDDGFREVHDVVAPLLERKGVPAIFFINPAFIDNKELFYRCVLSLILEKIKGNAMLRQHLLQHHFPHLDNNEETIRKALLRTQYTSRKMVSEWARTVGIDEASYLKNQKPFLTTGQLTALAAKGFTIGAHSWDHPHYRLLPEEEQLAQTDRSLEFVRQFGGDSYFSFPHEDRQVPASFFSTFEKRAEPILFFGVQNQKREAHFPVLHRYNAEDPSKNFEAVTKGVLLYNHLLALTGNQKAERGSH